MYSKKQFRRALCGAILVMVAGNLFLPAVQGQSPYDTEVFINTALSYLEFVDGDSYYVFDDSIGLTTEEGDSSSISSGNWDFRNLIDFEVGPGREVFLLLFDELVAGFFWNDGGWWNYNQTATIPLENAVRCGLLGDYLLVKNITHLMQFDVSDIENIVMVDSISLAGWDMVIAGDGSIYILEYDKISVIETDAGGLEELGTKTLGMEIPERLLIFGADTLVVSTLSISYSFEVEMEFIDISESPTLSSVATYTEYASEYMYSYDGYLYLGITNTIVILDLENLEKPKIIATFTNDWEDDSTYYPVPVSGDIWGLWGDGPDVYWTQEGYTFIKDFGEIIKEGSKFQLGIAPWAAGTMAGFFAIIIYLLVDKLMVKKIVRG